MSYLITHHALDIPEPVTLEITIESLEGMHHHEETIPGTLEGLTRAQAKAAIAAQGGRVASSVSPRTDFVVVGTNPGSKVARARELGIPTLDEVQLVALLGS